MKLVLVAQPPAKPAPTLGSSINWIFRIEAEEFISAADAMPEEKWSFLPTTGEFKGVRTFGGQVIHVACANLGFANELEGKAPPPGCEKLGFDPKEQLSKDKVMLDLRDSFAQLQRAIDALTPETILQEVDTVYPGGRRTRLTIATVAVYHVADHYGQLVEYLRLNGIIPPASRPRQTEAAPQQLPSKFGVTQVEIANARGPTVPPHPAKPVKIGGGVTKGNLIYRVDPAYPPIAKTNRIEGDVVLDALIAKDGSVKNIRVYSGHPDLTQAAIAAVGQWRYQPYTFQGNPVEIRTTITVHFHLK